MDRCEGPPHRLPGIRNSTSCTAVRPIAPLHASARTQPPPSRRAPVGHPTPGRATPGPQPLPHAAVPRSPEPQDHPSTAPAQPQHNPSTAPAWPQSYPDALLVPCPPPVAPELGAAWTTFIDIMGALTASPSLSYKARSMRIHEGGQGSELRRDDEHELRRDDEHELRRDDVQLNILCGTSMATCAVRYQHGHMCCEVPAWPCTL